ncbi:MAG: hypothetical protein ABJN22_03375 [Litorimonas sp.]|uniref:hypothetical protein n=1 Tax=Tateyamaria sp. TaxID=1929288 RepID=UPI003291DCB9
MRKTTKSPGEKIVKDIKRATRKHYSSEEKIRIDRNRSVRDQPAKHLGPLFLSYRVFNVLTYMNDVVPIQTPSLG